MNQVHGKCTMPQILRGSWFSWETGKPTQTVIDDVTMSKRGECINLERDGADYTFVFKDFNRNCYHCVKTYPRTLNVFEKVESPCVTLTADEDPSIERVCQGIHADQQLITLFNENYIPINCRSSLEGVWQFAYQVSHNALQRTEHTRLLFHLLLLTNYRIVSVSLANAIIQTHRFVRVKPPVHSS